MHNYTIENLSEVTMKLFLFFIFFLPTLLFASDLSDQRKVSDLSVEELTEIVRMIVEESIEQCVVSGTMQGRAKVNLKVEGEVVAKMTCDFNN